MHKSVMLVEQQGSIEAWLVLWMACLIGCLSIGVGIASRKIDRLDEKAAPRVIGTIIGLSVGIPVIGGLLVWAFRF
ncbi:MAG TPA: hypothetical protein VN639_08785 [Azonexus sp.]|nr:hypothetical protein [Azonexus sp.]